ncbi:MAG: hypothetical protein K6B65_04150 [Bacilli bacterium]|nr:hypothetical protein [Bacilli bacterium]
MTTSLKLKKAPLVLLSALGCLGGNTATGRCDLLCGKFVYNEALPFRLDYHDVDYPSFVYSWTVYRDKSKTETIATSGIKHQNLDTSASDPHFIYESSVPQSILKGLTSYCFEMKVESTIFGFITSNTKTYLFTIESGTLTSPNIALTNPEKRKVYNTSRMYSKHVGSTISGSVDSYYIAEIPSHNDDYHGVRVNGYMVGYHNSIANTTEAGSATLYIYTDPFEWNIGTLGFVNGSFYRRIPLKLSYAYSLRVSGVSYSIFYPCLSQDYAVDRYDSKMYPISKRDEDPTRYFNTRDVFLPIRNGKEHKKYNFKLHMTDFDLFGDTIDFEFSIARDDAFFGSCTDADYCIGLGN